MMHKDPQPASVALFGARGYSGLELARGLLRHSMARLRVCFATDGTFRLGDELNDPGADRVDCLPVADAEGYLSSGNGIQVAFLATPAEVSAEWAPRLLARGMHVIDLSGAFRLEAEEARLHYGLNGAQLALLDRAEYGLVPWVDSQGSSPASSPRLVSNPGCYATSILMALLPLLGKKMIDPASIVIDSKSGASGAGRKASADLLFCEVEGECLPYRVGRHQHLPEIIRYCAKYASTAIDPMFTPHLLGVSRGISSAIYSRLSRRFDISELNEAFAEAYRDYPLADCAPLAQDRRADLSLKKAVGHPGVRIRYAVDGDRLYLFSMIDNLLKGAATQAIENFNRIHQLPYATGLISKGNPL